MANTASITLTGLIVLAAMLFTSCQPQENASATDEAVSSPVTGSSSNGTAGLNVVYIRLDSLQTGYTELAAELNRLDANATKAQENIQQKVNALQREASDLQNKMQQGLLAPNKIQAEQQRLGRKEQEIMQQRDIALNSIQEDQMRLQNEFGIKVKDILTVLRDENGYDFIFNEGGGSGLLMASEAHDITPLVLERLNAAATTAEDEIEE